MCGLLGPNGAGKTTSVRILSTLLRLDEGRAEVAGFDVTSQPDQVRYRIGLVGQHPALDEVLTGRQNLVLFGRLFHLVAAGPGSGRSSCWSASVSSTRPSSRSTRTRGMRRRLDLAAGMILAPRSSSWTNPPPGWTRVAATRCGVGPGVGTHRNHSAAHHPAPGRGRPTRRPDLRGRGRPGDRRGHAGRPQVPARR
ncbi:ATP-binding cassette domain-containing protein [Micromonospora sp. M12]